MVVFHIVIKYGNTATTVLNSLKLTFLRQKFHRIRHDQSRLSPWNRCPSLRLLALEQATI